MWVRVFRKCILEIKKNIGVNTNNGVERKNKDLKYRFLCNFKNKSLSSMVTLLVEQFLIKKIRELRYLPVNLALDNLSWLLHVERQQKKYKNVDSVLLEFLLLTLAILHTAI